MSVEELGLVLAAVGALSVPPARSIAVKSGTSAVDGNVVARNGDKGTLPLLVAEGGGALEDDVGALLQTGQVKGLAGRDGNVAKGDGGARLLVLSRIGGTAGTAERAAGTLVMSGRSSDNARGSQCHGGEGSEEMHGKSWKTSDWSEGRRRVLTSWYCLGGRPSISLIGRPVQGEAVSLHTSSRRSPGPGTIAWTCSNQDPGLSISRPRT